MNDLSIVNVVGGGNVHRELKLQEVYRDFPNPQIEYDPEQFAAAVIQYDDPKGTIMLYSSGKYSLAGSRSTAEANEVSEFFVQQLENMLDNEIDNAEFEVRYLVGTADIGAELDLNQISIALGVNHTEYEPEQFPGLFYRPPDRDWFCLLFTSGKVVFSGCAVW